MRNYESHLRTNDRREVIVEENTRVVRDPDGAVAYFEGFVNDVTERRRAEVALREAHDRLEAQVAERTADLRREVAERRQAQEALQKTNRMLKMLSTCNQALIRAADEQELMNAICRVIVEAGGYRSAWVGFAEQDEGKSVRPVAQQGFEEGYLDTGDITWSDTERGRGPTGTAIRTRTFCVVQHVLTDLRFAPWRKEAVKHGYAAVVGLPLCDERNSFGALTIYADKPDAFDAEEVTLLEEMASDLSYGLRALRTQEEHRQAQGRINKLNEELRRYSGELEQRVVERTAELAVAKEKAEESDRLKSAFLASMSHELRTPLNSIIGFTGIVLQGLAGPLSDEQTVQLGMVQNSARHLLNLINDVLDISKIEAGQLVVASEPFDMPEAVEKVAHTLGPVAEEKGLALVVDIAPEVGRIVSDRRRVEQILINLVNNAVKFTEKGEVRITSRISDGWVVMRVADTGIGIKAEDMGELFQTFRQIDTGLSRQHEGTGLGLSIGKKLVEMLGGEIRAESEWGVGSAFTFTLPLQIGGGDEAQDSRHRG